jgi:multicomponent Na+:H+ antiporter subunit C
MDFVIGHYNYLIVVFLMMLGFYVVVSRGNMVKTLVGLSVFQTSVFIFYISMSRIRGGTAPILMDTSADVVYSAPLPQVLILTAIVVSISTTALGLAIVVRIKEAYGTIEEDEIDAIELAEEVGVPDIRGS